MRYSKLSIELFNKSKLINSILSYLIFIYVYYSFGWEPIAFLIISIVFHEIGHFTAFTYFKYNVEEIKISFCGSSYVRHNISDYILTPKEKLYIYLSGPGAGLFICIPILLSHSILEPKIFLMSLGVVLLSNMVNLAPYPGYDGYSILESLNGLFNNHNVAAQTKISPSWTSWCSFGIIFGFSILVIILLPQIESLF